MEETNNNPILDGDNEGKKNKKRGRKPKLEQAPETPEIVSEPLTPILKPLIDDSGLERTKAQVVLDNFTEFFNQASDWEKQVKSIVITDINQKREMRMAREARLALKDIRINAEKVKKKLKENIIIEGRFIDGIYNSVVAVTKPLEDELLEKEKFAEILEQKRVDEIKTLRYNALAPYELDPNFYDLAYMPEEEFNQLLINSKKVYEENLKAKEREEEERKRKEEEAQLERQRLEEENARLRKEAMDREIAEKNKNDRINSLFNLGFTFDSDKRHYSFNNIIVTFEQVVTENPQDFKKRMIEIEGVVRKYQEELHKLEQDRKRKEREDWIKLEEERIKKDSWEKAQRQAEAERIVQEEAEKQRIEFEEFKMALAPDKEKLKNLIQTFKAIRIPEVDTSDAKKITQEVRILVGRLTNHIEESIRKLP